MKTFLITGATNGIGKETAKLIIENKMHLIIVARNEKLINQTILELRKINKEAKIDSYICDFNNYKSIIHASNKINKDFKVIDYIYLNAGAIPYKKGAVTNEGTNLAMQTNYVGPRLFLSSIIHLMKDSDIKMILHTISMSSPKKMNRVDFNHMNDFSKTRAYALSKLAMSMYLFNLSKEDTTLKIRLIDPRIVYTNATINYLPKFIRFIHPLIRLVSRKPDAIATEVLHIINNSNTKNILVFKKLKISKANPLNNNLMLFKKADDYYLDALRKLSDTHENNSKTLQSI